MSVNYTIGAGGGGGGARLADYLMQLSDRENQITNQGKAADYFRKSLGDDAETQSGITNEQWANLGNRDRAAWHQGYQDSMSQQRIQQTVANQTAETAARISMQGAQADYYRGRAVHADAQDRADLGYGQMVTQMQQPNPIAANMLQTRAADPSGIAEPNLTNALTSMANPTPLSPMEHYSLAVRSGVDPARAGNMARNLLAVQQGAADNSEPQQTMIGGVPYVFKKGSKEFQPRADIVPGLKAENAAALLAQKQGGSGQLKDSDLLKSFDSQERAIHGDYSLDPVAKAEQLAKLEAARDAVRARAAGTKPSAAPAAAAPDDLLDVPIKEGKADPTQMQKGRTYKTQHGPARWDGSQFNLVK